MLERHPWTLNKARFCSQFCSRVCSCDWIEGTYKFSALPLQSLFKTKAGPTAWTRSAWDDCSRTWYNQGQAGLGPWAHWVLTNWHHGQPGNLSEMPGAHRWCACNKGKNPLQNCLTPPSEVKNMQFYASEKKKKTKTKEVGQEPSVCCENTWQASPHISLSKYHCQNQSRCERVLQSQQPCVSDFLTVNTGNQGREIPLKLQGMKQPTWKDFPTQQSIKDFKTVQSGDMWNRAHPS